MKIGVMQPYFFPYLGYFQLINAVDIFILYDDVNFIKNGWINRNRILNRDSSNYFTFPLCGMSPFKKINETSVTSNSAQREKMLRKVHHFYNKSPFFKQVYKIISNAVNNYGDNISYINYRSICDILSYLGLNKTLILSSEVPYKREERPQDTLINLIKYFSGDTYYNAIGGQDLYEKDFFKQHNICLKFIKSTPEPYQQFTEDFLPNLSIIDVLMFNSIEDIRTRLEQYELI